MSGEDDLVQLIANIHSAQKYQAVDSKVIERIGQIELAKRKNLKEAIKTTRSKLHQVATSFFTSPMDFATWKDGLQHLTHDVSNPKLHEFCRRLMGTHSSTDERLPILNEFYSTIFKDIAPIHSILDLACGLNPLAIPWMPIARDCAYYASDILPEMMDFLKSFFDHIRQKGKAVVLDLTSEIPTQKVQVALLLKTLPTLDQVDKHRARLLLDQIKAKYLVISYPVHSLGGKSRGMVQNYDAHFRSLTTNWKGTIQRFELTTELVFLLTHSDQ